MTSEFKSIKVLHPGLSLRVPLMKDTIIPIVCWYPNWKSRIISALLSRSAGGFVDVGANVGQTLCDYMYARAECGYWGMEPNPGCVEVVSSIIQENKIPDCTILNVALWETDGAGELFLERGYQRDTRATLRPNIRPSRCYEALHVPTSTFESVRTRHGIRKVGLIKIDVEGAELNVLRGMSSTLVSDRPPVLCEVLLRDKMADKTGYIEEVRELERFLGEVDYKIYRIEKSKPGPTLPETSTENFPLHVWTKLRAAQCDYLFLPPESAAQVRKLIAAKRSGHLLTLLKLTHHTLQQVSKVAT